MKCKIKNYNHLNREKNNYFSSNKKRKSEMINNYKEKYKSNKKDKGDN